MFQQEPQQSPLESYGQQVGSWLRSAANFFHALANQVDTRSSADGNLDQLLPASSPLRSSDCAGEVLSDAKKIIDYCRYDGAALGATRSELTRILALPPLSIEVGPLLRETLPGLLQQTPRGQSLEMLQAVCSLAEQYSQNRNGAPDTGRFSLLLSGLQRTLGTEFCADVLLD
jgi:hypothetical protein